MEKKHLKKYLAIMLLAQAAVLASCASETTEMPPSGNTETVTSSVVETDEAASSRLSDNLPEANFDGYNFRVLSCNFVGRELASFLISNEMDGDVVNDAVYKNTQAVADRFNVNFSIISVDSIDVVSSMVMKSVQAGDDSFDIQCGHDQYTASLGKNGYLYNLYDVEQFDFSQPWWPTNIVSQLSIGNALYLGSNYLTYNGLHWTRVLIANKDEFANHGIDVPFQQIIAGDWYLEDLQEIIRGTGKDLNGDGKMDTNDFYGFLMGSGSTYCVQDSFGLSFYEKSDTSINVSVDEERVSEFVELLRYFTEDKTDYIYSSKSENEFSQDMFSKGQVMIATTMIGTAYDEFRDLSFSFSILPYPKLDEKQKDYISTCTDAFWAIPTSAAEHTEQIGTIVEALSCANYQDVLPVYYETAIKTKLSDAPEDAAMFDIIRDTRTIGFEYAYQLPFANVYDTFIVKSKDASSYIEKTLSSAQNKADELFEAFQNNNE